MKYILILLLIFSLSCSGQVPKKYTVRETILYSSMGSDPIESDKLITIDVANNWVMIRTDSITLYVESLKRDTTVRDKGLVRKVYTGFINGEEVGVGFTYTQEKVLLKIILVIRWSMIIFVINYDTKIVSNEVHREIL